MQNLIADYESCRMHLQRRIYELNTLLQNDNLQTIERETITVRRDLLVKERMELTCAVIDMRRHLPPKEVLL